MISGPDANGIVYYQTDPFYCFDDGIVDFCLTGYPNYYQGEDPYIEYVVYNEAIISEELFTGTITYPEFVEIDGTPAVNLSDLTLSGDLLPASQSPNQEQSISIEGTLIIDEDYAFGFDQGGSQIVMEAGAKIVVNSDVSFSLYGSQLYGCSTMWDRIELKYGAYLGTYRTRIEDA